MSIRLTIKGTVIEFPESSAAPDWSPALVEFAQAVADAVNAFTGTYDVAPQVQNIDAYNSATNITIDNLSFPPSDVRAATIYYTVYRQTDNSGPPDGEEVTEAGTLEIEYNASRPTNEKWQIVRSGLGNASISFNITDLGQVRFTTTALSGVDHTGLLSYRAISILNTN